MTVLLTGASGFIGMNILDHLMAEGLPVVAFGNTAPPLTPRRHPSGAEVIVVQGDVRDRETVERVMREYRVNRVIHGAAITSDIPRERTRGDDVISVNLGGTAAVATAAARCDVDRFVLVGSIAVYGSTETTDAGTPARTRPTIFTEETPHAPVTLYDISKSGAEAVLRRIAELNGLDWRVGRLGVVFGPWERDTGFRDTLSPIHQANRIASSAGTALLPRPALANWQYSRDAARALVTLLNADAPRHRIYNLGPSIIWTLSAWCDLLAKRFPGFTATIGSGDGTPVDLYEAEDGPLLSWQRFTAEFGPTAQFGIEEAFQDYFDWMDGPGRRL
jgi:nucleoside-diphosphate-sugar epimerase